MRVFLQEEKPVQSDEILYDGLQEELQTRQQLKERELWRMFSVAADHFSLNLLPAWLYVVPEHNKY